MKTGRRSSVQRCDDVDGAWKKTAPDVVAETICRISKIEAVAPRVKEIVFNEGKAIITFDSAKLGLVPRDGDIPNFELAGDDRVFHNASAHYDTKEKCVIVSSAEVAEPVAVRYCWKNWCVGELKNTFGIPVGPFRSDDWDYKTLK